tara:strand:+ start:1342 stop:1518 length:177 start_codon:yes stop_codon:yes gene_type:complete
LATEIGKCLSNPTWVQIYGMVKRFRKQLSTSFFMLFGIVFMAASLGFWQLGKTDKARA